MRLPPFVPVMHALSQYLEMFLVRHKIYSNSSTLYVLFLLKVHSFVSGAYCLFFLYYLHSHLPESFFDLILVVLLRELAILYR